MAHIRRTNIQRFPSMNYRTALALTVPLLLVGSSSLFAATAQYRFDVWTTDNGLPQNSVTSILQTRDGYLWFTTFGGVVRYDGARFTVFNSGNTPGLLTSRFNGLMEDREGNLWIRPEGGLTRYKDGQFKTYTTREGLPHMSVLRMWEEMDGSILIENPAGLIRWKNEQFISFNPADAAQHAGIPYPGRSGAIWYRDEVGFHKTENGRATRSIRAGPLSAENPTLLPFYEDRQGTLWIRPPHGQLMRYDETGVTIYSKKDGWPEKAIEAMCEDRQGNLWIASVDSGLFRFKDGRFTQYQTQDGLPNNSVHAVYEDREGTLWVGTSLGLCRIRETVVTPLTERDGISSNNVYPILQGRSGEIWIGSWPGLTRYANGILTPVDTKPISQRELITALCEDREGNLWVGTWDGGLRRIKDKEVQVYEATKDGLVDNGVHAIHQDRAGDLWFGTRGGLNRYRNGSFTRYHIKDGLPGHDVRTIYEDRQGFLWLGTNNGIARFHGEVFRQQEGLSARYVRTIYEDSDGIIWIGTYDNGLKRLKDGKATHYTTREGLFDNGVFQILEDSRGNFWISCNLGIYRVRRQELNDFAEGKVRSVTSVSYGKHDGMLNSECNGGSQPAGMKTRDGKLWFPTQGGVAIINPEAVPENRHPPSVSIEEFLVDNEPVSLGNEVRILPGKGNFEIQYTALSFILPEKIRFKFKLEGLDTEWVDAGTRRAAYYSHVSPGNYTFRVIAANRDGVWNLQGAAIPVVVVAPFWRTWWFMAFAVLGLAGLAFLAYKRRIAHLTEARAAQEAFSRQLIESQENERKRIAGELHDGLGQQLLIIKNWALLALTSFQDHDKGKEQLEEISSIASQAIEEAREIAHNLRPYQLDELGLTRAFKSIVSRIGQSSDIQFISDFDSVDGLFSKEAEINLYRIVQESINNIVKHSGATEVRLAVKRDSRSVQMTIHDNGRGFDPEAQTSRQAGAGGMGLAGISERMRILGGKHEIRSAPGQGTTIILNLGLREKRDEN
jgi:ligand-binding sensor domain-containing protein/signal transduction histidine kinase